jgi:hypothetical protein
MAGSEISKYDDADLLAQNVFRIEQKYGLEISYFYDINAT